jgi:hypothetical protein
VSRFFFTFAGLCLVVLSVSVNAQMTLDIKLPQKSFIKYEVIEVEIHLTNNSSEPLDLGKEKGTAWLDFYVTTSDDLQINKNSRVWNPPSMLLLPGEIKTVSVDILPFFQIRQSGDYTVTAEVTYEGKTSMSPTRRFSVESGVTVWTQRYTPPASTTDSLKGTQLEYSLLMHRLGSKQMLYARIQDSQSEYVYCNAPLGHILSYGDPSVRIDRQGNFHIFHQSGTRIYNYSSFSASGKHKPTRYFSNMSSTPQMVADSKGNTEIVGGEEIFEKNGVEEVIPTAPMARPPKETK